MKHIGRVVTTIEVVFRMSPLRRGNTRDGFHGRGGRQNPLVPGLGSIPSIVCPAVASLKVISIGE